MAEDKKEWDALNYALALVRNGVIIIPEARIMKVKEALDKAYAAGQASVKRE